MSRKLARSHRPQARGCGRLAQAEYPAKCLRVATTPWTFQAAHVCGTQHADQVWIFAEGLLDASPAVVANDVQDWRQSLMGANGAHVCPDCGCHSLYECGIERRCPCDRCRVDGGAKGREACPGTPRGRWQVYPSRVFVTTSFCSSTTRAMPSAAETGAVPNARVMCPNPCFVASANETWTRPKMTCIGPTLPVFGAAKPSHLLPKLAELFFQSHYRQQGVDTGCGWRGAVCPRPRFQARGRRRWIAARTCS